MDHDIAPVETYLAVQEVQPTAVMVFKEHGVVTGVIASLFLTQEGLSRIIAGEFSSAAPDLALLTREGERPGLLYSWGVAADTRLAAAAILKVGAFVCYSIFPTIAAATHTITEAGRRTAQQRFGYRPWGGADPTLMIRLPAMPTEQAA
jgi:hypothetical protein